MAHSDKQLTLRNFSYYPVFMYVSMNWTKPNRHWYIKKRFHFMITVSVPDDSAILMQERWDNQPDKKENSFI
jgi:hypothetical protein